MGGRSSDQAYLTSGPAFHGPRASSLTRVGASDMKTLFELCRERGEKTALLDMRNGAATTYAQLANYLLRGGAFLRSHGVGAGDSIVQRLPNSPEALCLLLVCLENGVDCAPLSLRASAEEASQWV